MNIYRKLKYISADCGAGKTHALINMIKRSDDFYIVVQGTLQLVEQSHKDLGTISKMITSRSCTESVEKDITTFLLNPTHRVLVITDKAFMRITDLSLLRQWRIYLDDVVNFHTFNVINTEKKFEVEKQLFKDIDILSEQYVTAKAVAEFDDDLVRAMAARFSFIQEYDHFVMNSNFFTKIGKVGNQDVYSNDNKQLTILAWVDIAKYSNLDITFMANKFEESLIYKGNPNLFEEVKLTGMRERTVPVSDRLKVYYFSEERFTRTYRDKNPEALPKVAEWINNHLNASEYFYTTNADSKGILSGKYIDPISRGMNTFQDYTKCVWLASMKPSPVETKQLELMFSLTREEVVQARERENLYQFINRSNLRDYSSTNTIAVYVFDKEQAQSISTNIDYIDIGLDGTDANKFVPLTLSRAEAKRLERITKEKYPTIEEFDKWMSKRNNMEMNQAKRDHFYAKYSKLQNGKSPSVPQ